MSRSKIYLCVFFVILTSCGGGNSGGGNSGGGSSEYQGVRAVDLACPDFQFWGECVLTWADGSQQKVCEMTVLGCRLVGSKKGEVVRSIEYLDLFGNRSCLKLWEGGWIEDCYNPSQWLMPSGGGDASAAGTPGYVYAPQSTLAIGDGQESDISTTSSLPPAKSLVASIYNYKESNFVESSGCVAFDLRYGWLRCQEVILGLSIYVDLDSGTPNLALPAIKSICVRSTDASFQIRSVSMQNVSAQFGTPPNMTRTDANCVADTSSIQADYDGVRSHLIVESLTNEASVPEDCRKNLEESLNKWREAVSATRLYSFEGIKCRTSKIDVTVKSEVGNAQKLQVEAELQFGTFAGRYGWFWWIA